MQWREKAASKGRAEGAREDKDALLREFERKLLGIIRREKGTFSAKARKGIRALSDEYVRRWGI